MKHIEFLGWLEDNKYNEGTIKARVANCLRVEEYEGNLDNHYLNDKMGELIRKLTYSIEDKRNNRHPNHSIPINGDIYNGTATLRSAVNLYKKFIEGKQRELIFARYDKGKKEIFEKKQDIILDSYERFIENFNIPKEKLYEFGLSETILPNMDVIEEKWIDLKKRLYSNKTVFIRGAGRDAKGTQIYLDFYKEIFCNDSIVKDSTNNREPQKIIQELTGYKRNQNLFNYQVSHIFGKTKNPLMFEAPWNIAFVPKIIDPFTGHETKGMWPKEYQKIFFEFITKRYDKYIKDYNSIISSLDIEGNLEVFQNYISDTYNKKEVVQFIRGIRFELSLI